VPTNGESYRIYVVH
jgi:uncharacterized protein YecA (UPF0149 family)